MNRHVNKRFHQRKQLGQWPLAVEVWSPHREGKKSVSLKAQSVDISSGGVGIVVSQPLRKGDVVKIDYPVNGDGVTLPVFSEVIWCRTENGCSRVGLRFLG